MKKIETSALIGLGALGILFGRKMPGVQVIADKARIARYSAEPVVCNGEECQFTYVTPEEGRPVDLLLVAVKATVLEQAIRDMAKFVGPDTVILSVLNGITSEEHIDAAYPGHTLWSVAIGMDATRTGRKLVFNQAGKIQFGERSGEMTARVQAVADYLDACGIANEPCSDILYKQWNKLMVNDGLNQAAAAFDQPYGGLRQPGEAQDMMRKAMQEVIQLANLEGVPLPPDNDVKFLDAMMPTFNPEGMPSMRQDVLAKRPTEVAEFAGVVRERAKKYGMPTPANDFFYTRIREIEAGYNKIRSRQAQTVFYPPRRDRVERGEQDLRHDRQPPDRAGPGTGPPTGRESPGQRRTHRRDLILSPVPRRRHCQSHCRRHRSARPVRAAPAGAVLRQIRGHTPQRRGVPRVQNSLCRPLRRRRKYAAAGPAHLQPAGRIKGRYR